MCSMEREMDLDLVGKLQSFKCKFLSCFPVKSIDWQTELGYLNWYDQKLFADGTVLSEENKRFPVKKSYQVVFLKAAIEWLESWENADVHDSLYEALCTLQMHHDDNDGKNVVFRHFHLPNRNETITLKECTTFVSDGTTGLCSWQASIALSEWLLQNEPIIRGRSVVELGSGTGLCGLVAAKHCAVKSILLSDGSTKVLNLLNENLSRNLEPLNDYPLENDVGECFLFKQKDTFVRAMHLPWENIHESNIKNIIKPEVILAADVVYDSSVFDALLHAIKCMFEIAKKHCFMVLAATVRNRKTLDDFLKLLDINNFEVKSMALETNSKKQQLFWDPSTEIELFRIGKG